MKIYLNRFFKGIFFTGVSLFFIFHEYGTNYLGSNHRWRDMILSWGDAHSGIFSTLASIFVFLMSFLSLIYLCKGVYFLFTCHMEKFAPLDTSLAEKFKKPCSGYEDSDSNIENFKKYRNAKMATMTNSEAAAEYKKTAWVDGLTSDNGKNTKSVKRYIDSQLAAKSNEQGYNWLKK